jgi:3-hydroxybutyrate dehydrogenase
MTLKGRRALVTGSTSGIGLGIAEALAAEGAELLLHGLGEPEALEAQRRELAARFSVRVELSRADVSKPAEVALMIADAGKLDILVNNAGIQHTAPIEDFPAAKWDDILAVNLSAAFHAIRLALPAMKSRGWGRIVNIASVHGLVASVHKAAYVAAKHGLVGLTKVVALETAASGVTCNAICPGWVRTPLVERQIAEKAAREAISVPDAGAALLREKQPSGEFATPAQIGALVVFLCSPAAEQIRGAALSVDGGWSAQ